MPFLNIWQKTTFYEVLSQYNSCVNQLIPISQSIHSAFEANPSLEVYAVFLDLSKTFEKVWHEGFLYKLKNSGINGNLLDLSLFFITGAKKVP